MKLLYVSYYTTEPHNYKPGADRLRASLDARGLNHDIQHIADQGGWQGAVRFKPTFIRAMMEAHPEAERIVWVDADAIVHKRSKLLEGIQADLACYFHPHPGLGKEELLSGTFLVANTPKMRKAMDAWIRAMKTASPTLLKPEQMILQGMLPRLKLKVYRLPRSHCMISRRDVWDGRKPQDIPFVQHTQWSRENRWGEGGPPKSRRRKRRAPKGAKRLLDGRVIKTKLVRSRRGVIFARRAQKQEAELALQRQRELALLAAQKKMRKGK